MLPPSKSFLFPTSPKLLTTQIQAWFDQCDVCHKEEGEPEPRCQGCVNKGLNWIVDDCSIISPAAGSIQVESQIQIKALLESASHELASLSKPTYPKQQNIFECDMQSNMLYLYIYIR